jgi:hypothetical protein
VPATYSNQFQITYNSAAGPDVQTINVDSSMSLQDLANEINAAFVVAGKQVVDANVTNNQLVISTDRVNDKLTDSVTLTNGASGQIVSTLFGSSTVTQNGYDFERTVRVYDSLGGGRDLNVYFKKTAVNQWHVQIRAADKSQVLPVNPATGKIDQINGDLGFITDGTLSFNNQGTLTGLQGGISGPVTMPWNGAVNGAGANIVAAQTINFDFGTPITAANVTTNTSAQASSVTQDASPYNVNFINQNGAPLGQQTGVTVDSNGFVIADVQQRADEAALSGSGCHLRQSRRPAVRERRCLPTDDRLGAVQPPRRRHWRRGDRFGHHA